jgi:hypothetical protein
MVEKNRLQNQKVYIITQLKNSFFSCSFKNITVTQTSIKQLFHTLFCLVVKMTQTTNVWKKGALENIQAQRHTVQNEGI